ncbi:MAG: HEAT repeat domain-containing protein [Dehalococcoidia bacterium]|nr:HEAT repeat domain-containing protein [Dehalococcoidia bacterium]
MLLERLLQELADQNAPVRHGDLANLSGVAGDELQVLKTGWAKLPVARRVAVVSKLLGMAEDNPEMNFDAVFESCLKDEDAEVREKSIEGLWESEAQTVCSALVRMLCGDPAPNVRAAAAHALGRFIDLCQESKPPSRSESKLQSVLLSAATNPSETLEVRRRALEASAPLALSEVKELIRKGYVSEDLKMRASAVFAMGRNGDPCWVPIVARELSSPIAEMRYEAAAACGLLGMPEMVHKLLALLKDEDLQVQLAAIEALGAIGAPIAKKALQEALNSPEESVQQAAEEALSRLTLQEDPLSFRHSL